MKYAGMIEVALLHFSEMCKTILERKQMVFTM